MIPALILLVMLVAALFAPLIAPHSPIDGVLTERNLPPVWYAEGSTKYLLGTDPVGRDILSRVIYGTRISLTVAGIVLAAGAVGGTVLGMVSGYFGGLIDEAIQRFVEFEIAVPFILVALVVVVVLGQSLTVIVMLLIVFSWGGFTRQVRGETLQLKTRDYVAAARIAGAGSASIIYKHIWPGVINTVMVIASLRVGTLIITESVLSFLGVGIPPPTPAWGLMVAEGRQYIASAWWITFFPGVAIFLTVLAFNFLGDWLRDRLDPRLRQQL
ncbi:MAG: ABC transporter permease [Chloroflexi bacterium]|nr:ABC transporter permease [Chloroflexota bacterium]